MPGYAATEAAFYRLVDQRLGVDLQDPDRYNASAWYDKNFKEGRERYRNSRSRIFPDVAEPPLPVPLPLEDLTGTYFHPGYGNMTLKVARPARDIPVAEGVEKVLHVDLEKELTYALDWEHVSGLHFIIWLNLEDRTPMLRDAVPGEFVLGSDGKVVRLGAAIEPTLDQKIWFDKV